MSADSAPTKPSHVAGTIRRLSVPVILAWVALAAVVNVVVPQIEEVAEQNSVSLASRDAPSYKAMKRQGAVFGQFDSDSVAMGLPDEPTPCRTSTTGTGDLEIPSRSRLLVGVAEVQVLSGLASVARH